MGLADSYIRALLDTYPLREPVLRSAIGALHLPDGGHGLDVGCGIGLPAFLLAEAIGPEGHVTGLDILPELVTCGHDLAAAAGLAARVTFCQGDMWQLPFAAGAFDWAWSMDCVGYPAGDLPPLLSQLARVVRPGGRVVLLGWTSQQLLPGYPLLETRLNAACSGYLPFLQDQPPERHFLRALASFRDAGLEDIAARTFAGDVHGPLSDGERAALASLFDQLWVQPRPGQQPPSGLSPEDWAAYRRLCLPGSPEFILDRPDYYAFFTYTLFAGTRPASRL